MADLSSPRLTALKAGPEGHWEGAWRIAPSVPWLGLVGEAKDPHPRETLGIVSPTPLPSAPPPEQEFAIIGVELAESWFPGNLNEQVDHEMGGPCLDIPRIPTLKDIPTQRRQNSDSLGSWAFRPRMSTGQGPCS